MGFGFRRRISLGPLARINLSKSGVGFGFGAPGANVSFGPGGRRTTLGIPGTGLFWRSTTEAQAWRIWCGHAYLAHSDWDLFILPRAKQHLQQKASPSSPSAATAVRTVDGPQVSKPTTGCAALSDPLLRGRCYESVYGRTRNASPTPKGQ